MVRRVLRWGCWAVIALALLAVGVGYFGWVHPAGDAAAVVRVPLALIALLGLLLLRRPRIWVFSGGVLCALALGPIALNFVQSGEAGEITVYNKNMFHRNRDLVGLEADIRESGADVVTLQEASSRNSSVLQSLSDLYPNQVRCSFNGWNTIAILSKHPLEGEVQCTAWRGAAAVEVAFPQGNAWVVSVHLSWPYPYPQMESAEMVRELIEGLDGPKVVAGDFNVVPWAWSVRMTELAAGGRVLGPRRHTYVLRGLPLPIDHVIAPSGQVERRPRLGSDHFGLLGRVDLFGGS